MRIVAAVISSLTAFLLLPPSWVRAADLPACMRVRVRFDGSRALRFDRVTGSPGARLYIHNSYPTSCDGNHSTKSCVGEEGYLLTGDEVAAGKSCGKWTYIQYIGVRRITQGWVDSSRLKFIRKVGGGTGAPLFTLTRGRGIPVCEAYLQRLNVTDYSQNLSSSAPVPYCGIPENDQIIGFKSLHRVPLAADLVVRLSGELRILWYQPDPHLNRRPAGEQGASEWVGLRMKAWRYSPEIDVDNDGASENIIVWQGYGLTDGAAICGEPFTPNYTWGYRPPQMPLVMNGDLTVDLQKTATLFGRRGGKGLDFGIGHPPFHPIGHFITLFEYRGLIYLGAFFDSSGDYEGRRRGEPDLANTLGVFLRRHGSTKQLCEYRLSGDDYPPANATASGVIGGE